MDVPPHPLSECIDADARGGHRPWETLNLVGLWGGIQEFLPVLSSQGLCPRTPTGEFPPQTPVSCATNHPPHIRGFVPQPPRPTAGKQGVLLATLTAAFGGRMLSIYLFFTLSGAKIRRISEPTKHFSRKFSMGGVCYQYDLFYTFSGATVKDI